MTMIWKLFVDDVRHLLSTVVTIVITVGLVMIPGLFAWFNIAASWDPFGNTKSLKVAIANTDAGYSSDNLPITVNVGDQVVSELRANTELDWAFTSKDEAINGTKSGKYYAAVIIPKDFSATMLTFFSPGAKHPKLTYVTNEKLNAVAPKLTGEGADQIAAEVNTTFSTTLTGTALRLARTVVKQLDAPQAQQRLGNFSGNVTDLANQLNDTASMLHAYRAMLDASGSLLTSSDQLLAATADSASKAGNQLKKARSSVGDIGSALSASAATLSGALSASGSSFNAVNGSIDKTFADASASAGDVSAGLRRQSTAVQHQLDQYGALRDAVQQLANATPESSPAHAQLEHVADGLQTVIDRLIALRDSLNGAANDVDAKNSGVAGQRAQIKQLASQASSTIDGVHADVDGTLKPQIASIAASLNDAASTLDANSGALQGAVDSLHSTATSADADMASIKKVLDSMADLLTGTSKTLSEFSGKLSAALSSGDMQAVRRLLSQDPATLASALAARCSWSARACSPWRIRHCDDAVLHHHPAVGGCAARRADAENRGVAPAAAGFAGCWRAEAKGGKRGKARGAGVPVLTLAMVPANQAITTYDASHASRAMHAVAPGTTADDAKAQRLKPHQLFLGHFGIFALISLAQSTFSCGGTLLFLRVHAAHPWLFMLCGWVSGLVFMLIVYTLIVSFGNIGKAIIVIVLVMQVSGTGGAYPLQVVPGFIQDLSPFLPAFHAIEATRAAVAGIYDNDLFKQLGLLLIFAAAMLPVGLLLRKPLVRFNRWAERRLETTKLM
jgi:putative membrane protein